MADAALVRRRLLAIFAARRPDVPEDEREELVDLVVENLDLRGDLTLFWKGIYEVPV